MFTQNKISLKKNIISNFAGQGWVFLVGMITVPLYIRFIGVDGYGLVGFYGAIRAIFNSFLDFGLTVTIKRELARYIASPIKISQTRDLVRTLEIFYWLIGLLLGLAVCLGAPIISTYWINSETIPAKTIENVIVIMGIITFIQWPLTFYQGGLIGLQKIVLLNSINVIVATLRGVGSVLAVWLFSPPIIAFFVWQVFLSLIQLGMTTFLLWHHLPVGNGVPRFRKNIILEIWRFAFGMSGASFFSFFLTQADKVVLSKILTLEQFGYYSLAITLNEQLQMVNMQIYQPLFPRFSALISQNDKETLQDLYHKACQLVSVVILPVAGTAAFFSWELIYLWTRDIQLASNVAPIATILFTGTVFFNLFEIPMSIAIAYGWVKFALYRSAVVSMVYIPLLLLFSLKLYGVGAAMAWALINLAQLIVIPIIIHRKILVGELEHWGIFDVGIPLVFSVVFLVFARSLVPSNASYLQYAVTIGFIVFLLFGFLTLLSKDLRKWVYELRRYYFPSKC